MNNVYLLYEKKFKEYSIINSNVSMELLYPYIRVAEDMYVQQILGSALWSALLTAVQADNTLSQVQNARYKYLMDNYVTDVLVWWTMYEAVLPLAYRFTNNGINTPTPENQKAASPQELQNLKDNFKGKAQWYSKRLVDFLTTNASDALTPGNTYTYAEYVNPGNTPDTIVPMRRSFKTGIYLGVPVENTNTSWPDYENMYQGSFPWPWNNGQDI